MIGEGEIREWAMSFYLKHAGAEDLEDWKVFFLEDDYVQIMIRLLYWVVNHEINEGINF